MRGLSILVFWYFVLAGNCYYAVFFVVTLFSVKREHERSTSLPWHESADYIASPRPDKVFENILGEDHHCGISDGPFRPSLHSVNTDEWVHGHEADRGVKHMSVEPDGSRSEVTLRITDQDDILCNANARSRETAMCRNVHFTRRRRVEFQLQEVSHLFWSWLWANQANAELENMRSGVVKHRKMRCCAFVHDRLLQCRRVAVNVCVAFHALVLTLVDKAADQCSESM